MTEEKQPPIALLIDPLTGSEHYISRYTTCIGRSPTSDLRLCDRSISRQHALLFCLNDEFYLEDLNSLNGTVLNGKPVDKRTRVQAGDEIRIGLTCLLFMLIPDRRSRSRLNDGSVITTPLEDPISGKLFDHSGNRDAIPHAVAK
jgi:pSer/pThr/pTyr-binding forkhead associated (FHA) protein